MPIEVYWNSSFDSVT